MTKLNNGIMTKLAALMLLTAIFLPAGAAAAGKSDSRSKDQAQRNRNSFAHGQIAGMAFEMHEAFLAGNRILLIRSRKLEPSSGSKILANESQIGVQITFPMPERFEGQVFSAASNIAFMSAGENAQKRPDVVLWTLKGAKSEKVIAQNYQLKLQFFRRTKGQMPGFIDLSVTDAAHPARVRGYFYALEKNWNYVADKKTFVDAQTLSSSKAS